MRIAHVITRMILGGAQENTLLCCQDLIRAYGDDVLLVTGPALGLEGSLIGEARAGGVPLVVVPHLRRAIHPWRDLRSYVAVKRILADFRPDVVHTHSAKAGILGRLAAAALRVPAVVHTVHGAPFHPYQGRAGQLAAQWCERYAAGKCHALVSVADAMTDLLVGADVAPREKFTTIYSGMDIDPLLRANDRRDEVRKQLGYQPPDVVVGKVARLFHLKGHGDLVGAASCVVARFPDVHFLLVGDGILRRSLRRQIDRAGLAEHFQLLGLVEPKRIPGLIGAMDVVVHTSLREGLARVLPQALIAGKPVVSYDVDGAREVVVPDETGYLVAPKNVPQLAEALMKVAADEQLRRRLGSEGRRRFTSRFGHQQMTAHLRQLYTRLLNTEKS